MAWIGILAIIVLSVVPANDRPVSGVGQGLEHFNAFALVGGAFAIGYRFLLIRLLVLAVFFCGGIELLQVPLPTRHARVSDFLVASLGACFAIFVLLSRNRFGLRQRGPKTESLSYPAGSGSLHCPVPPLACALADKLTLELRKAARTVTRGRASRGGGIEQRIT